MNPSGPEEIVKIEKVRDGMRTLTVKGKILEISEPRRVYSRKIREPLTVSHAAMRDETGRVALALWNEQIQWVNVFFIVEFQIPFLLALWNEQIQWVNVGDNIRVENGYVTSYMGVLQLNVGIMGKLIVLI